MDRTETEVNADANATVNGAATAPCIDPSQCALCFFAFEDIPGYQICCGNPTCGSKICKDCLQHLLHYCARNKFVPNCPVQSCQEIYLYSDVKRMDFNKQTKPARRRRRTVISTETLPEYIENTEKVFTTQYEKASFGFFLKSNGDAIRKQILEQEMLNKIRAEKLHFLENSFPPAVGLVARVAFKHKLHRVNENKKELVHLKVRAQQKKCFYQVCTGFLEANGNVWVCMLCDSRFCKKCENALVLSSGHTCNEADVKSLGLINDMIRCPGCNLPVFKDIGCDFITCSNSACGVHFHYKTGEITNHGSINSKIILAPAKRKLSIIYENRLNGSSLALLLLIESMQPVTVSKNIILRPLHKFMKNKNDRDHVVTRHTRRTHEQDLAVALETYTRYKQESKRYTQALLKIENQLQKPSETQTMDAILQEIFDTICL